MRIKREHPACVAVDRGQVTQLGIGIGQLGPSLKVAWITAHGLGELIVRLARCASMKRDSRLRARTHVRQGIELSCLRGKRRRVAQGASGLAPGERQCAGCLARREPRKHDRECERAESEREPGNGQGTCTGPGNETELTLVTRDAGTAGEQSKKHKNRNGHPGISQSQS